MFKRIKNLLDISRYTVQELRENKTMSTIPSNGLVQIKSLSENPEVTYTVSNNSSMATIIDMQAEDPFNNFDNETPEQSSNDSTPRN